MFRSTPQAEPSRRSTITGIALLTSMLIGGGGLLAAGVAHAEVQEDATFTLALNDGRTSGTSPELDDPALVTLASTLRCPEGAKTVNLFVSEQGDELATTDGYVYPNFVASDYQGVQIKADGTYDLVLPGIMLARSGSETGSMSNLIYNSLPLDPAVGGPAPGEYPYSIGVYCGDGNLGAVAGADGKAVVAFGTIIYDPSSKWRMVTPKQSSSTTVSAANSGSYAASVTATVTPANATGEVEFFDEADKKLGSATIDGGKAVFEAKNLSIGDHTFTAAYLGSDAYAPSARSSASNPVTIVFVKLGTTLELDAELDSETTATLTVGIRTDEGPAIGATGDIVFALDGETVERKALDQGVATVQVSDLEPGTTYAFTASYAGDDKHNGSASLAGAGVVTTPAAPVELKVGEKATPGVRYYVDAPAGTFEAGDTVAGAVGSDPIALPETATAAADGSVRYVFTLPAALAKSTEADQELVLTGTPSGETFAVAFVIDPAEAGGSTPTPTPTPTIAGVRSGDPLAVTGADGTALGLTLGLALGALALGSAGVASARVMKNRRKVA